MGGYSSGENFCLTEEKFGFAHNSATMGETDIGLVLHSRQTPEDMFCAETFVTRSRSWSVLVVTHSNIRVRSVTQKLFGQRVCSFSTRVGSAH